MKQLLCTLLVAVEVAVCFGPAVVLLLFGLMFVPISRVFDPDPTNDAIVYLAMAVGGALGLIGLLAVLDVLVSERPPQIPTRVILVFVVLGCASLLPLLIGSMFGPEWRMAGLLPILAITHLIFLARAQLFRGNPTPTNTRNNDV